MRYDRKRKPPVLSHRGQRPAPIRGGERGHGGLAVDSFQRHRGFLDDLPGDRWAGGPLTCPVGPGGMFRDSDELGERFITNQADVFLELHSPDDTHVVEFCNPPSYTTS